MIVFPPGGYRSFGKIVGFWRVVLLFSRSCFVLALGCCLRMMASGNLKASVRRLNVLL